MDRRVFDDSGKTFKTLASVVKQPKITGNLSFRKTDAYLSFEFKEKKSEAKTGTKTSAWIIKNTNKNFSDHSLSTVRFSALDMFRMFQTFAKRSLN